MVTELVAQVSLQRVVLMQRHSDLLGELAGNPTRLVDRGELLKLPGRIGGQLGHLDAPVSALHVGLRADRHILTGRHGHRPSRQPRNTSGQDRAGPGTTGRHTNQQARGRHQTVIGPQHRRTQPTRPTRLMPLRMPRQRVEEPAANVATFGCDHESSYGGASSRSPPPRSRIRHGAPAGPRQVRDGDPEGPAARPLPDTPQTPAPGGSSTGKDCHEVAR